jgi:hypothetical protein
LKKALFLSALLLSPIALAANQTTESVTIINHFQKDLKFVATINADVVPELRDAHSLNLRPNEAFLTTVKPGSDDEAYISVDEPKGTKRYAFWGIDIHGVRGYIAAGVSYSWDHAKNAKIIFCSNEDYDKKGHC